MEAEDLGKGGQEEDVERGTKSDGERRLSVHTEREGDACGREDDEETKGELCR